MSRYAILHAAGFDPERLRPFFPACRPVRAAKTAEKPPVAADETIVFALPNAALGAWTAAYRDHGRNEAFVFPCDTRSAGTAPIPIELSKPRLDYFETEISETCNLNCRGCCDYSNLLSGRRFYEFEQYLSDLKRMRELFWGVEKIRIMGGEPLLNPRLPDYAEAARSVFPDADLRIVSNGLLIPSLSADTLRRIREAGCSFDVSNYPPTRKRMKDINRTLREAGIAYDLSFPMNYFFRNLRVTPADDPAPAFRNCIFTHCHMLGNGRLAPCSYAYCVHRFNERFGTAYPETDWVDLYHNTPDGWEILRRFSRPHEFCRCCGSGIAPIRWKGDCRGAEPKASDWQIPPTFWNLRVLPAAQRLLKPAAVRLRARIQKKK